MYTCVCYRHAVYEAYIYCVMVHGVCVCVQDMVAIAKNSPGNIFKSFSLISFTVWGPDGMSSSLSSMLAFGIVSFHLGECI